MDNLPAPRASPGTAAQARYAGLPTAFAAKHPRLDRGQLQAVAHRQRLPPGFKNFLFGQPNSRTAKQPPYAPRPAGRSRTWGCAPRPLWGLQPPRCRRSGSPQPCQLASRPAPKPPKQPPARFKRHAQGYPLPGKWCCWWPWLFRSQ